MRLCHLLQQDSGGSLSNGGKEGRRQRARRPVFEDRWQKKGVLAGRCGAALVGVEVKNAFPEGGRHLDFCPCLQISVQQAKGRPYPLNIVRNIRNLRPLENTRRHSLQPPPPSSLHPPSSPCLLFLKEKCERRKKQGKECSARGGRWRKPHFFRRAAASGLLRWL